MLKQYQVGLALLALVSSQAALAATPIGCLIEPERVAEVGSQVIGVVDKVMVERGDTVRKGQVLATLRSEIERASVDAAQVRSQLVADVKSAEANLELARVTEKRSQSLVEKKFLSPQALDKAHAEAEVAQQRLALAKEQLRVADSDLGIAKAQLNIRAIRAPFDGIIADRYIWPGERVEEKALFRLVKINPLRVELVAPVELFGTIQKSDYVNITPDLPDAQLLEAKVTLVDRLVDGASNTFRIRAEIANPTSAIPSGLRCKAEFPNAVDRLASRHDKLDKKLTLETVKYAPVSRLTRNDTSVTPRPTPTPTRNAGMRLTLSTQLSTQPMPATKSNASRAKSAVETRAYY